MSVHQTGDGRWYSTHRISGTHKPQKEYFGRGEKGYRRAKDYDDKIKAAKKLGLLDSSKSIRTASDKEPSNINRLTFGDLAQKWIDKGTTKETRASRKSRLNLYVMPYLGEACWETLTPDKLVLFRNEISLRSPPPSWETIRRTIRHILEILNWAAVVERIIERNPATGYKHPKRPPNEPVFIAPIITDKELVIFLESAPCHLNWACDVCYNCCTRFGSRELFALTWECFDWTKGEVNVIRSKTLKLGHGQKSTTVPLKSDFIERALTKYNNRDCEFVVSYNGKPVKSLKTTWETTLSESGIGKRFRPTDLRHYYITKLFDAGVDPKTVQTLVGHADLVTTLKYYREVSFDQLKYAINSLPPFPAQ